jgi:predicted esterase
MPEVLARSLATTTHGRFLVCPCSRPAPHPLLVGFHGYGENAERHLDQLRRVPGAEGWLLVAVQGLHRFYSGKMEDVVASWMTRQDREQAIADNVAYVNAVVAAVVREYETTALVFAGFSQGVAMAYRAALAGEWRPDGLIALGGDIPPDVRPLGPAGRHPPVLVGRGTADGWYTAEKLEADLAHLRAIGVSPEVVVYDGGHEWTHTFHAAAGRFLARWGRG